MDGELIVATAIRMFPRRTADLLSSGHQMSPTGTASSSVSGVHLGPTWMRPRPSSSRCPPHPNRRLQGTTLRCGREFGLQSKTGNRYLLVLNDAQRTGGNFALTTPWTSFPGRQRLGHRRRSGENGAIGCDERDRSRLGHRDVGPRHTPSSPAPSRWLPVRDPAGPREYSAARAPALGAEGLPSPTPT